MCLSKHVFVERDVLKRKAGTLIGEKKKGRHTRERERESRKGVDEVTDSSSRVTGSGVSGSTK